MLFNINKTLEQLWTQIEWSDAYYVFNECITEFKVCYFPHLKRLHVETLKSNVIGENPLVVFAPVKDLKEATSILRLVADMMIVKGVN